MPSIRGGHDDVCFHACFHAGLDDSEVGLALGVRLLLTAHLFVGVDVFFVGEDVRFGVFAGDWLIA